MYGSVPKIICSKDFLAIANCIPGSISHWTITVKTCAGVTLASIKTEIYALHALYWTRCHRVSLKINSREKRLATTDLEKNSSFDAFFVSFFF